MDVYKPGQGKYTRAATFVGVVGVTVLGAVALSEKLRGYHLSLYVCYGVPTAVVLAVAGLMFWLVNRPRSADFLIATEGEMKKVSWSSRREISGSTKVVIVTTLILSVILFTVDFLLAELFRWLRIMG